LVEKYEIKIYEPIYLFDMKAQIPTTLLFRGNEYVLKQKAEEKKEWDTTILPYVLTPDGTGTKRDKDVEDYKKNISKETAELQKIAIENQNVKKERGGRQVNNTEKLGDVVARCGTLLIRRKPLEELLKLKEEDKMTPLNMVSVLRKYYPDVARTSISVYRTGYQNFINKNKNIEIRMNTPLSEHETVTEKDKEKVYSILSESCERGAYLDFDEILRELDMTEYKLKLILKKLIDEESRVETVYVDGKLRHRIKELARE
jgi:hypothetical protein